MKKYLALIASVILLTGCATSGTSKAEESFIAGTGAVTKIKSGERKPAPELKVSTTVPSPKSQVQTADAFKVMGTPVIIKFLGPKFLF